MTIYKNKVYLVGAGPGDPNLITVKAKEILRQAEVVIYDYLVDRRILGEARQETELICCDKLGKNRYSDSSFIRQERINNLIAKKAKQGKKVVRLKNGDASISFSTGEAALRLVLPACPVREPQEKTGQAIR